MEQTVKQRYSSRKFRLATASLILAFISLWADKTTGSEATTLVLGILTIYFSSNVGSAYVKQIKSDKSEE